MQMSCGGGFKMNPVSLHLIIGDNFSVGARRLLQSVTLSRAAAAHLLSILPRVYRRHHTGLERPVTHCIFDMDGLLLDTENIYFECFDEVLKGFGHRYNHEMANRLRGTSRAVSSKITVEHYQLPITADEFLQKLDALLPSRIGNCQLMPGADRLVRHLHKHKVPIAIATGSSLEYVKIKTRNHQEFIKLFLHLVSGSDDPEVKQGKPAPDVFLVCARRFSPPIEGPEACGQVLVFEDAPNGVRAALAANMQVVMVPDPKAITPEQRKEPTICINSLENFRPELFGLPPFSD